MPILPAQRDPRLITIRRGGSLTDEHHAALPAGQAVAVAHVAAHDLGAAAYAIRAIQAAAGGDPLARIAERDRQRARLPAEVRDLVLEDQAVRSAICWHAFDD